MEDDKRNSRNDDIYTKVVRAGKRTYFFDVKATKAHDLYLTVTESIKSSRDGGASFEKHKIFLYKEDFDKFLEGMQDALDKIESLKSKGQYQDSDDVSPYSTVDFDEL